MGVEEDRIWRRHDASLTEAGKRKDKGTRVC